MSTDEKKQKGGSDEFVEAFNQSYTEFFLNIYKSHVTDRSEESQAMCRRLMAHCAWVNNVTKAEGSSCKWIMHAFGAGYVLPMGEDVYGKKFGRVNRLSYIFGDHTKYPALAEKQSTLFDGQEEDVPDVVKACPGDIRLRDFAGRWSVDNRDKFWKNFNTLVKMFFFIRSALYSTENLFESVIAPLRDRIENKTLDPSDAGSELIGDLLSGNGNIFEVFKGLVTDKNSCESLVDNIGMAIQPDDGTKIDLGPIRRMVTEHLTDKDRAEALAAMEDGSFSDAMAGSGMADIFKGIQTGGANGQMPDVNALLSKVAQAQKEAGTGGDEAGPSDDQMKAFGDMIGSLQKQAGQLKAMQDKQTQ